MYPPPLKPEEFSPPSTSFSFGSLSSIGFAGGGEPENALIGLMAIAAYNGQRVFVQVKDDAKFY